MKLIQYHQGSVDLYQPCIAQARRSVPDGSGYRFYENGFDDIIPNCEDYRAKSNLVRMKLAIENTDMLWLDTDAIILRWPRIEFTRGKVYFARGIDNWPVNWAFYVNGRVDFFQRMESYYWETLPTDIGWFTRFLKNNLTEIEYFPDGYFDHIMLSKAINAGKFFNSIHAQNFSVTKSKSDSILKVEVYK